MNFTLIKTTGTLCARKSDLDRLGLMPYIHVITSDRQIVTSQCAARCD